MLELKNALCTWIRGLLINNHIYIVKDKCTKARLIKPPWLAAIENYAMCPHTLSCDYELYALFVHSNLQRLDTLGGISWVRCRIKKLIPKVLRHDTIPTENLNCEVVGIVSIVKRILSDDIHVDLLTPINPNWNYEIIRHPTFD